MTIPNEINIFNGEKLSLVEAADDLHSDQMSEYLIIKSNVLIAKQLHRIANLLEEMLGEKSMSDSLAESVAIWGSEK